MEAHTKDACQINMDNRHKLVDCKTYGSFLIRIYGKMFADFVSGDLSKPTVALGPHFSCKVLNYNATYIVCQTESSGVGKDLSIIVQNTKTGKTNYDTISKLGMYYCANVNTDNCRETISFKAPRLHGLSAVQGDTRGNFVLTLSGENFGSSVFTFLATIRIKQRNVLLSNFDHISDNILKALVPPGSGKDNEIKVQVGGQWSNSLDFSYYPPIIRSVFASRNGGKVVIYGDQFANFANISVSFFLAKTMQPLPECTNPTRISYNELHCSFALGHNGKSCVHI